jgi:hypothetical protein
LAFHQARAAPLLEFPAGETVVKKLDPLRAGLDGEDAETMKEDELPALL